MSKIIVAITGASGSVYAWRLLQVLAEKGHTVYLTVTDPGRRVLAEEMGITVPRETEAAQSWLMDSFFQSKWRYYDYRNIGAAIASGSNRTDAMVVLPCSMATVAGIAHGLSSNLVERAADIMLKEHRPLILVPRETPLNAIHLRNMLTLAEMGVHLVPAMPAFYHRPQQIRDLVDFLVGRILDLLGIEHQLFARWQENDELEQDFRSE